MPIQFCNQCQVVGSFWIHAFDLESHTIKTTMMKIYHILRFREFLAIGFTNLKVNRSEFNAHAIPKKPLWILIPFLSLSPIAFKISQVFFEKKNFHKTRTFFPTFFSKFLTMAIVSILDVRYVPHPSYTQFELLILGWGIKKTVMVMFNLDITFSTNVPPVRGRRRYPLTAAKSVRP